jgi:hypothetical protein
MLFKRVRKPKPPPEVIRLDYARPPRLPSGPSRWERIVGLPLQSCVSQLVWQLLLPVLVVTLLLILRANGCLSR